MSACCQPARYGGDPAPRPATAQGQLDRAGMVLVPAGPFLMGNDRPPLFPGDGEGPVREVHVEQFLIDACAVSNAAFARFTEATGHVTDAELFGWSFVFVDQVAPRAEVLEAAVPGAPWWRAVVGATWRHPGGPGTEAADDHPAVHVSWHDAQAYAAWAGKRLPTEPEWEKAARGGLVQEQFPWGSGGREGRANTWEGTFPTERTNGPAGTVAVDAFATNGFGLHNAAGNVWEWTADEWAGSSNKVVKGGSFLCHPSYCHRYRVAGRTFSTPDSSTGHTGFRCAA